MNKQYTYLAIAAVTLLASCTSQEAVLDDITTTDVIESGVSGVRPQITNGNATDDVTRTSLAYDYEMKEMDFSWAEGDKIGVMPIEGGTQQQFDIYDITANKYVACFENHDSGVRTVDANKEYIAYSPYMRWEPEEANAKTPYKAIPVTYKGQTAKSTVKMAQYYAKTDDGLEAYKASEKEAAAHLGAFDYCSTPTTTSSSSGNCRFKFQRAGAVTRFFLKCPKAIKYTELQVVVQGEPILTVEGKMNATDLSITPTTTSHTMSLKFSPVLDMSDPTETSADYYYNGIGYIVTYMMVAPVDLTSATDIFIYLIGEDGDGNKQYFKSASLSKPNLVANMLYQWTSANNNTNVAPIIFDEIKVQDWENGTDISNGDEGTGTEGW